MLFCIKVCKKINKLKINEFNILKNPVKKSRNSNKDVLEVRFYLEYKILSKEGGVGNYS